MKISRFVATGCRRLRAWMKTLIPGIVLRMTAPMMRRL
jgi:hypothetical protein